GFDLEDFRDQLQQMRGMGGLGSLMDKLPMMGKMNPSQMEAAQVQAEKQFKQMEAIINSMTPAERRNPDIISGSRKRRIAAGSGAPIQDIGRVITLHDQLPNKVFELGGNGGMPKLMRGMGGLGGGGMLP